MKRCENWSVENYQCKFNYTPHPWIDDKDLDPRCNGFKSETECSWYKGYHLDIAGNDLLLRKFRNRIREKNLITNCIEERNIEPLDNKLKTHLEKRDKKELEKTWGHISHD